RPSLPPRCEERWPFVTNVAAFLDAIDLKGGAIPIMSSTGLMEVRPLSPTWSSCAAHTTGSSTTGSKSAWSRANPGSPDRTAAPWTIAARRERDVVLAHELYLLEVSPDGLHHGGETEKLLQMELDEQLEPGHARRRESEPHDTLVVGIPRSFDQARGNGAVNQLHRTVVPEQQVTGSLADGGTSGVFVATDGEQQLMLGRSEPHRGRLILTPSQESSEAGAELQETSILGVSDLATHRQ